VYPPHTVAQFSDHAIYNPSGDLKNYGLTIANLSHSGKNLSITLSFNGMVSDKAPAPSPCFLEFYGKTKECLEEIAAAKHQVEINSLPTAKKST